MATISALLSAYRNTPAGELRQALDSLARQTRPADEVVVVFDGPVSDDVERLAEGTENVRVVTLAHNVGLGPALQAGLETITSDYVARLDTDDIAHPERIEKQVAFMEAHPDIAALGTAVREFSGATDLDAGPVRAMPETHEKIAKYTLINSPLNHPSVMLRTAAIKEVGGYQGVHFMEDYDLWARLIAAGKRLHNMPEPLTYFRVSPEQFARRTGREMFAAEREMQARLVSYGLVGPWRARFNLAARTTYRLLPMTLLTRVYTRLFTAASNV
ncbi:glycosyltransferase [Corynebacterium sanguinis]|uniref:Glycosyltransferase n=1 Tax=Corynebacterium sanguinis TaxID=2594913 RepID=A0A6C1U2F3_9CORY|nr:glycosyltransferase [Corynebacterium sanguinis]TVS29444.1 glycosyltransferase [Corynebacterium sanguinis]